MAGLADIGLSNTTSFRIWSLVPIKKPFLAKTRLSGLLSVEERARLQWAMLEDVLDQLSRTKWLTGVAIVCPDKHILRIARSRGIIGFEDDPGSGDLNKAVARGTEGLRANGADMIVVVPGDVPMLDATEIDRAICYAIQENASVVVPDQNREGTNALIFRTDRAPCFQFGKNSCRRHLEEPCGGSVRPVQLASIARDIDLPDDLHHLRMRRVDGSAPNTNAVLDEFGYLQTP